MVKKGLMIQLWRLQQSQAMISLFFWALTLAGVYYVYFHPVLVRLGLPENQVFVGIFVLFSLIIITFLILGLLYDRVLKLWVEQTDVAVERNPYSSKYLLPKDIMYWQRSTLPIMRGLAKSDPALLKDIEFMEKWIDKSLAKQKGMKDSITSLENWIAD